MFFLPYFVNGRLYYRKPDGVEEIEKLVSSLVEINKSIISLNQEIVKFNKELVKKLLPGYGTTIEIKEDSQ